MVAVVKVVIQNINSNPIQKETIEFTHGTKSITSPQNFQPVDQLTVGGTVYLYYDKPFKVQKEKSGMQIVPAGEGRGWKESPDQSGKAPKHREVAIRGKNKTLLNHPIKSPSSLDPQQIADERIRTAPNKDWHRKYRVRNSKEIEVNGIKGLVVLIEFTEPIPGGTRPHEGNFVGANVIVAPGIHMNESNPIIFYDYRGDTWEKAEIFEFERAERAMKHHIEYKKCSKCGSYKPPRTTSRRAGRELVYVTSTCVDCGLKEVEPYD